MWIILPSCCAISTSGSSRSPSISRFTFTHMSECWDFRFSSCVHISLQQKRNRPLFSTPFLLLLLLPACRQRKSWSWWVRWIDFKTFSLVVETLCDLTWAWVCDAVIRTDSTATGAVNESRRRRRRRSWHVGASEQQTHSGRISWSHRFLKGLDRRARFGFFPPSELYSRLQWSHKHVDSKLQKSF